jgi:hypothetical protein
MKITKKQYATFLIETTDIGNCEEYRKWLLDNTNLRYLSRLHLLCKDNREDFKKLWGKADWHYNNGEFYFSVWVKEFQDATFIILTSKGKGTCIEFISPPFSSFKGVNYGVNSKTIIDFCQDLYKKLLTFQ